MLTKRLIISNLRAKMPSNFMKYRSSKARYKHSSLIDYSRFELDHSKRFVSLDLTSLFLGSTLLKTANFVIQSDPIQSYYIKSNCRLQQSP